VRLANRGLPWRLRAGERRLILIVGDLIAASAAAIVAVALWARLDYLGPDPSMEFIRIRAPWFVLLPIIWLALMINLYDLRRAAAWRETFRGVMGAAGIGGVLYLLLYFTGEGSLPRRGVLYFLALVVVFTLIWRGLYTLVFTAPAFMRRVLVVGAGESGVALVEVVNSILPPPFHIVGLIDDDASKHGMQVGSVSVKGDNSILLNLVEEEGVSDIVVSILGPMNGSMFQALLDAQERGAEITRMPVAYEELLGRVPINYLESDWLLRSFVDSIRVSAVYSLLKRLMDLIGGLIGLGLMILFLPWIALAIVLESGRPIVFFQDRLGQGGKVFRVAKFRTMRQDAEADGQAHWAMQEDPRATHVGRLMRKAHLDELPQFWNVLRGEMSLVGPRPERPELVAELEKQIPFYRARLLVKPGLTGWAQINYGKGASVEGSAEKLEYDLYYIKHRSLVMDLWILLRTFGAVIGFRGV
jgi:exopolysaccharide biosynthesis polyprenyl glycosylphosphotransferase